MCITTDRPQHIPEKPDRHRPLGELSIIIMMSSIENTMGDIIRQRLVNTYDPNKNRKLTHQEVKIRRFQQACLFSAVCGSAFLLYTMEMYKQKRLRRMQQRMKRNEI